MSRSTFGQRLFTTATTARYADFGVSVVGSYWTAAKKDTVSFDRYVFETEAIRSKIAFNDGWLQAFNQHEE